ncbi:MAG: FixH family protein [Acidimicrobiales bacterium]
MNRPGRGHRRRRFTSVLISFVAGLVMVFAGPVLVGTASAHGDDATAELVAFTPAPDGASAQVTVRLTFQNDGDPVGEATVTISGDDAAGRTLTPATLDAGSQPGLFEGTLTLPGPGTWNLRVTSIEPEASLAFTQTVDAAPTSTTSVAPTTTVSAVSTTTDGSEIVASERAADTSDDEGSSAGWIVVVAAAVVLVAAIAFVVFRRRTSSDAA